jgi:hypothetical protein
LKQWFSNYVPRGYWKCAKKFKLQGRTDSSSRLRENFIFKSLRVESMNYCFKSPPPKFQPQVRSKIAHSIKKVKQSFHRFIWRIKKLLISFHTVTCPSIFEGENFGELFGGLFLKIFWISRNLDQIFKLIWDDAKNI